jgi:hypothetical protein
MINRPKSIGEAWRIIIQQQAKNERLRKALQQVWDCEEYESCPTCKLIARNALEDSDA